MRALSATSADGRWLLLQNAASTSITVVDLQARRAVAEVCARLLRRHPWPSQPRAGLR
jgi:hypothetical protein